MLDEELEEEMRKTLPESLPSIFISSMTQKNIGKLKDMIWEALNS
jgi:GTP-binding protein